MKQKPIIISGGGICGLACALAASQAGYAVIVLEKAVAFEPVGAGLQLGPNAVRALQSLDAWGDVAAVCQAPQHLTINDALSGHCLRQLNLDRFKQTFGAPYRVALRADLHSTLLRRLQRLQNVELHLGQNVKLVERSKSEVLLTTENGDSYHGQGMIVADGIHSVLRKQLWPASKVIDSGLTFHRAKLVGSTEPSAKVDLWMGPHLHMVRYDVGEPLRRNLVCITQNTQHPNSVMDTLCASTRELLRSADSWSVWPGIYLDPLENWAQGNCLILGDAAHGTMPFLAQGAAMALEDAAWLKSILQTEQSLELAFAQHSHRMRRTRQMHFASLRQGRIYHQTGISAHIRNFAMKQMPEWLYHRQLAWIYQHTE